MIVTDERMVLQLIADLNENFDTVGTYFTQLTGLPSFYDARSKLILEETHKQKQTSNNPSSSETALLVTNSSNKPNSYAESTPSTDRSNTGHNYRGYHNSPYWASHNSWQYANQWAQPRCPYPTKNWARPNATSPHAGILGPRPNYMAASNASTYCPTDIDSAMHTMTLNPPDDTWYMDTGATSHMAANSEFDPFSFTVRDFSQGTPVLRCNSSGDLYPFTSSVLHQLSPSSTFATLSSDLWHYFLGHLGASVLRSLRNKKNRFSGVFVGFTMVVDGGYGDGFGLAENMKKMKVFV
ncbi:uncharacterized protein [Rutidosis leptorrhynchoides]|uniref:uncharacterized protein n=1 Tax=Rutidosis leptorrhynchoides TaxID=125765 RepID=UPI003A99C1C8